MSDVKNPSNSSTKINASKTLGITLTLFEGKMFNVKSNLDVLPQRFVKVSECN